LIGRTQDEERTNSLRSDKARGIESVRPWGRPEGVEYWEKYVVDQLPYLCHLFLEVCLNGLICFFSPHLLAMPSRLARSGDLLL
jgi:hypothetical protein